MPPPTPPMCAACGYDLSATPIVEGKLTCPECGGNRIWLPRWYEPRVARARSLAYLPACVLVGLPGGAVAAMVGGGAAPWGWWLLAACPPYVLMGLTLAAWRPGVHAGVTVMGLGATVATTLGVLASASTLVPSSVAAIAAIPLAAAYYVLPVPLGVLWAYAVLDDTPQRESAM